MMTALALAGCGSVPTDGRPAAEPSTSPSSSADPSPTGAAVDVTGAIDWQPTLWHKPTPTPVPPGPDCRASQLRVAGIDGGDGASGHLAYLLTVENTSGSRCILRGRPGVSAVGDSGREDLPVGPSPYVPGPFGQRPAGVEPGAVAEVLIDSQTSCDDLLYQSWHDGHLIVGGGELAFPTDHRLDGCGLNISPWTSPQQEPPDVSALHAHLELPTIATSGATLTFVARLDARGGDVHLDPCPAIWMLRTTPGTKDHWESRRLALPCPVPVIHDGESLRFVMQAPMPVVSESTTVSMEWDLYWPDLGGDDSMAEGTLDVVPS